MMFFDNKWHKRLVLYNSLTIFFQKALEINLKKRYNIEKVYSRRFY
jgi:hypothetical protein